MEDKKLVYGILAVCVAVLVVSSTLSGVVFYEVKEQTDVLKTQTELLEQIVALEQSQLPQNIDDTRIPAIRDGVSTLDILEEEGIEEYKEIQTIEDREKPSIRYKDEREDGQTAAREIERREKLVIADKERIDKSEDDRDYLVATTPPTTPVPF